MTTAEIPLSQLPHTDDIEVTVATDLRELVNLSLETTGGTAALDLTNATWELNVSDYRGGTSLLAKTTAAADYTSSGVLVLDAAGGEIAIVITEADTATLGVQTAYYEVALSLPASHALLPNWESVVQAGALLVKSAAVG